MRKISCFVLVCVFLFSYQIQANAKESFTDSQKMQITFIIGETQRVIALFRKEGGEEVTKRLEERLLAVESEISTLDKEKITKKLRLLRAEVLFQQSRMNLAMAYFVSKNNSKQEIEALKFLNRVQYLLKSIQKRITSVIGK